MAEYVLHLTEEQAKVLANACEFAARIKMGQFQEIIWSCLDLSLQSDNYCERRDKAEEYLFEARKYIYPELRGRGHSYGIGYDKHADMAFDVYQVLRNALGWTDKTPFSYYDVPKVEVVGGENG